MAKDPETAWTDKEIFLDSSSDLIYKSDYEDAITDLQTLTVKSSGLQIFIIVYFPNVIEVVTFTDGLFHRIFSHTSETLCQQIITFDGLSDPTKQKLYRKFSNVEQINKYKGLGRTKARSLSEHGGKDEILENLEKTEEEDEEDAFSGQNVMPLVNKNQEQIFLSAKDEDMGSNEEEMDD